MSGEPSVDETLKRNTEMIKSISILLIEIINDNKAEQKLKKEPQGKQHYVM
jgi:hypothetical protein